MSGKSKLVIAVLVVTLLVGMFSVAGLTAPKKVTMWCYAPNNVEEWQARKADIDKKFNIDFTVKMVAQNAYVQTLQAAMMNNKDVPDIIEWMIEQNQILFANPNKSFVIPLDKYVAKSKNFKNVPAGRVEWVKYGGHVYGIPHDIHPVVLIYNDTLWKAVGVDVATIKTWDEFMEAAKKLTAEKQDGKPLHYALPTQNGGLNDTMLMLFQQTGAQILDKNGKPSFTNNPALKEFITKWLSWYKSGVMAAWDWGAYSTMIANGVYASYVTPDWYVSQVDAAVQQGKYKFKVRALPLYKEGGSQTATWGGTFMAIPKTKENIKNADFLYKIIEYGQLDEAAAVSRFKTTGMLSPLTTVWNNDVYKQPDPRFGGQKLGELQTSLAKQMPSLNNGELFWTAIQEFGNQYSEMVTDKISVDEGLKRTQEAVEKKAAQILK